MTDQELKDLVAGLAISHRESVKEADRRFAKLEEQVAKTDLQLVNLAQKIDQITQEAKRRDIEAERRAMEAERRDQERAIEAERRAIEAERRDQERAKEAERRAMEAERRAIEAERRDQERAIEAERRAKEAERRDQERAKEADRRFVKADRRFVKLEKQFADTDRRLKKIAEMVGGMSNNQGQIAEEFFFRSFKKHPQLGNLRFDHVHRNWRVGLNGSGLEDEFDLILTNGDTLALFEVKTKAHTSVVKTVIDRKIPNLRTMLPHFKEHKIYGGVASLVTYDNLIKEAEEHGLFLITQQGKHLEVVNTQVRPF